MLDNLSLRVSLLLNSASKNGLQKDDNIVYRNNYIYQQKSSYHDRPNYRPINDGKENNPTSAP